MEIKFDKKLYNKNAIEAAIQDYREVADFDLAEGDNLYTVKISKIDKEVEKIIKDEFCNYVLFCMTNNG